MDCLLPLLLGLGLGLGAPLLATHMRGPLNSFTRGSALKLRWLGAALAGEVALAQVSGVASRHWMVGIAVLAIAATLGTLVGVWRLRAFPFWRRVRPWWFRPLPAPPRMPRR